MIESAINKRIDAETALEVVRETSLESTAKTVSLSVCLHYLWVIAAKDVCPQSKHFEASFSLE